MKTVNIVTLHKHPQLALTLNLMHAINTDKHAQQFFLNGFVDLLLSDFVMGICSIKTILSMPTLYGIKHSSA